MRGKKSSKRKIKPDPKYNSVNIAKFINYIMRNGKKTMAQQIVYGAFDIIKNRTKQNPTDIFDTALKNVAPILEVRGRRVGGSNYQVPVPVKGERRLSLAYHWLIDAAKSKKGKSMAEKLADEFMDAYNKQGSAIKKRDDVHRMAESNRAFAHFAR